MAAGLTDKIMDVADIVRLIDAHEIERKGKAAQSFRVSVRVDRPSLTDLRGVSYTTSFRRLRSAWSARRSQACAILSSITRWLLSRSFAMSRQCWARIRYSFAP